MAQQSELARTQSKAGWVEDTTNTISAIEHPPTRAKAMLDVRLDLAAVGKTRHAIELSYDIGALAEATADAGDAAECWVYAALALGGIGEEVAAARSVFNAIGLAGTAGRGRLIKVLRQSLLLLGSVDSGNVLWRMHEQSRALDRWWEILPR